MPAGTQKIGDTEYNVQAQLAAPLKIDAHQRPADPQPERRRVTYMRDVAFVHDGHPPQTNIVRVERPARRADVDSEDRLGLHAQHRQ